MDDLKNKTFKLIIKSAISKTDKSAILLNLNSGSYYELNDVAHLIVQNLDKSISFKEIKEIVVKNFDIEEIFEQQCFVLKKIQYILIK